MATLARAQGCVYPSGRLGEEEEKLYGGLEGSFSLPSPALVGIFLFLPVLQQQPRPEL